MRLPPPTKAGKRTTMFHRGAQPLSLPVSDIKLFKCYFTQLLFPSVKQRGVKEGSERGQGTPAECGGRLATQAEGHRLV